MVAAILGAIFSDGYMMGGGCDAPGAINEENLTHLPVSASRFCNSQGAGD
jgi:hypothetical protein